jgi:hypothetical protein
MESGQGRVVDRIEESKVIGIVVSAFDGVPRPDTSLRQFQLTDEKGMSGTITDEEWADAGGSRPDRRWQDLSDVEIEACGCQLAHMQGEDFRYYLPAYLRYAIRHAGASLLDGQVVEFTIYGVTPSDLYAGRNELKYSLLDTGQRAAIAAVLRHLAAHADEDCFRRDAEEALAYWGRLED